MKLTGDELRFQRFSAPTHLTGYVWEEEQVKCKRIDKKNHDENLRSISSNDTSSTSTGFMTTHSIRQVKSDTVFLLSTRKVVKQSYQQVVFWRLYGLSDPMKAF